MQKLKFRAWDKRENTMTDPFVLGSLNAGDCFNGWDWEVMLFTGLLDKTGKEIFEGDIIDGWAVTYCGDQESGLGMAAGWYLQRDDFESWTELQSRCNENGDNYEVSGNIYENPELLTK